MQGVGLFLRAQVVIKFVLQAANTFKITGGEQGALRKFSAN